MFATTRRRATAVLAAGTVPFLLLTACSSPSTDSGSGATAGGEVRMLVNLTDNLTQDYWNKLVKPFEDKTGIDVKIEGPTGKSVAETFPTQLAAGTAPDVIQSLFPDQQTAPELVDLSGEGWVKDTPMADTYAMEGKNYVVGVGSQAQSLVYYNKSAFAAAGITKTPETWDEFNETLQKLKTAGFTPLQSAGQFMTGLQLQQLWHPTLNIEHPKWQSSVTDESLTVGQAYQPMFEKYSKWIEDGYIAKDAVGLDPSAADANFIGGKVGMYPLGSWFVATLVKAGNLPFEVGVFSPPVDKGQDYPGPQGATMATPYMVYQGSKNLDASKQLVQYLVTDETAIKTQLTADGGFRAGYDVQTSDAGKDVQKIVDSAPSLVSVGQGAGDNQLPVAGFNPRFTQVAQSLFTGASPQDAANSIDQWVKENR